MNDKRLLKNVMFMSNGKQLMAEYFKFQVKQPSEHLNFDLITPNEVTQFLLKISTHLDKLD
jgi:hypothetical protein